MIPMFLREYRLAKPNTNQIQIKISDQIGSVYAKTESICSNEKLRKTIIEPNWTTL